MQIPGDEGNASLYRVYAYILLQRIANKISTGLQFSLTRKYKEKTNPDYQNERISSTNAG